MTTTGVTRHGASGNMTGILAMLGAMAAFVISDTLVKILHETVPLGELVTIRSLFAVFLIVIIGSSTRRLTWPDAAPLKLVALRVVGEILTACFYLSGLVLLPIADATAIFQCTPLVITAAAAIFLKERAGWRRWTATLFGLVGVLLIVRPGTAAFSLPALLILAAVLTTALRDLTTRYIPLAFSTETLTLMSAAAGIASGLMFLPDETWITPSWRDLGLMALCAVFISVAFALVVIAMRNGEVAVVSPFRYAIIPFAIFSDYVLWAHLPEPLQGLGIAIIILAGVYTFDRERALTRTALT